MTRNQIEYWKLKEEQRSNKTTERETARSNRARERETFRSNVAKEAENERSNRAREKETARANTINMVHAQNQDAEQRRHNQATEGLTAFSTDTERQRVDLGYYQADVNRDIGYANANVGYANVAELQRSHLAQEQETFRHNLINEQQQQQNANTREYESRTGRLNANTNAYNANTNRAQQQTAAGRLALDSAKWATTELPQGIANIALTQARTATERESQKRMGVQNRNDTLNAMSNFGRSLFQNARDAVSIAGVLAGGRK